MESAKLFGELNNGNYLFELLLSKKVLNVIKQVLNVFFKSLQRNILFLKNKLTAKISKQIDFASHVRFTFPKNSSLVTLF